MILSLNRTLKVRYVSKNLEVYYKKSFIFNLFEIRYLRPYFGMLSWIADSIIFKWIYQNS